MRPWKLSIEFGEATPASTPSPVGRPLSTNNTPANMTEAWSLLVAARRKAAEMVATASSSTIVNETLAWIGGGLAVLAATTGESAEDLLDRLSQEVPMPEQRFKHVERERPKPPPGAPRSLDISTLTDEEREELGIVLPDPEGVSEAPTSTDAL